MRKIHRRRREKWEVLWQEGPFTLLVFSVPVENAQRSVNARGERFFLFYFAGRVTWDVGGHAGEGCAAVQTGGMVSRPGVAAAREALDEGGAECGDGSSQISAPDSVLSGDGATPSTQTCHMPPARFSDGSVAATKGRGL